MEYLAQLISKYASFFQSYGNWVLIPFMFLVFIVDHKLSKLKFTPNWKKWAIKLPLVMIAVITGTLIYTTNFALEPMVNSLATVQQNVGDKIDDFAFIDVRKDSIYQISDFEGSIILLNFWGTYCGPCIAEFPDLRKLESTLKDEVRVIALSDENTERILNFVQRVESPAIVGSFAAEKWIDLAKFRPVSIIIDKQGIVREYMYGRKSYESFKEIIEKYL